jgi:hypothetical protein
MRRLGFLGLAAAVLAAGPVWAQGHGGGGGHGGGNGGGGGGNGGGHGQGHAIESAAPAGNPGRGNGGGHGGGDGGGNDGDGGGHGQGHGSAMQAARPEHGRGNDRGGMRSADHGDAMRAAERGNASSMRAERHADRGPAMRAAHADAPHAKSAERSGRGPDERPAMAAKLPPNHVNRADADGIRLRQVFTARSHGLIDGCPPGLAAKNNGCRPPGLARQQDAGWRAALYQPTWWGLSGLGDGRYYYDDGYLYRLGAGESISSYVPLLGGALGLGNAWPSYYPGVELPGYYQRYYGLGPLDTYRYADNVIYRVDPTSSAISSIAALLTGDTFNVGQRLPVGYDVYNVPYPYRAQYPDTSDAWYRYSDGYVYQVDPKTQLIAAAIELLTS